MKALMLTLMLIIMPVGSFFTYREFMQEPNIAAQAITEDFKNLSQKDLSALLSGEDNSKQAIDNPESEFGRLINSFYVEISSLSENYNSRINEIKAIDGCIYNTENITHLLSYKKCMNDLKIVDIDFTYKLIKAHKNMKNKLTDFYSSGSQESELLESNRTGEGEKMFQANISSFEKKIDILERYYRTEVDLIDFLIDHQGEFYTEDGITYFDTGDLADEYNELVALSQNANAEMDEWVANMEKTQQEKIDTFSVLSSET